MSSAAEYAVFTELSPDTKPATPGFNRRVFTDTDINKGSAIQCDFATGIVTLAPGAYQISGHSMVAYFTKDDPPETIVTRSPASAGYCRLRSFDPLRQVEQALVGQHALDAQQPAIQLRELLDHRIFLRRRRCAAC